MGNLASPRGDRGQQLYSGAVEGAVTGVELAPSPGLGPRHRDVYVLREGGIREKLGLA